MSTQLDVKPDADLSDDHAIQAWQCFANIGGNDKDRMITTSTWLLAFSGTILGYRLTEGWSLASALLTGLGILVSALAAVVTLVYGGYANRAWAKADAIARQRGWRQLVPEYESVVVKGDVVAQRVRTLARLASVAAKPCDPIRELPFIFSTFFWLAIFAMLAHLLLFISIDFANSK